MKRTSLLSILFSLLGFLFKAQDYNFPVLNNNVAVNDSLWNYSFVLVGNCGGPVDYHTLMLTPSSGLAPIASSINLRFVVTKTESFPSSTVFCTQTGTIPVVVGTSFKFTNSNQQYAFTCTPGATVTGKFMITGTPTIINEPYECGVHVSLTLGSCNNNCMLTGLNKWFMTTPQCSVGISNFLAEEKGQYDIKMFQSSDGSKLKIEGHLKSKNLSYEILALNGQVLQKTNIRELQEGIDISFLPTGVYLFKLLENNTPVLTKKWLKN